jgi:hypothetical protein
LKTLLNGKSITISQFRKTWEKNAIIMMIELLGAQYDSAFKKARTTHVISATDHGDKFVAAVKNGRAVVSREWLNDSAEFGYPADESKYTWPDAVAAIQAADQAAFDRDAAAREALMGIDPNEFNYTASKAGNNDMMDVGGDVDATGRDDPLDVPATGSVPFRTNLVHPAEPVLTGVRLYVGKVVDADTARTIAAELGAEIAWDCDAAVTHVLWEGKNEIKYGGIKAARDRRVPFVSPYWLLECRKHMKRAIETQFPPEMNPITALVLDYIPSATTVRAPARATASAPAGTMGPPPAVPKRHQTSSATKFLDEDDEIDISSYNRAPSQPASRDTRQANASFSAPEVRPSQPEPEINVSVDGNQPDTNLPQMVASVPDIALPSQSIQTHPLAQRPTMTNQPAQVSQDVRTASPPKAPTQIHRPLVIQHDVERQEEKRRQLEEDKKKLTSLLKMIPGQYKPGRDSPDIEVFGARKLYELAPENVDSNQHERETAPARNSAAGQLQSLHHESSQDDNIAISSSQFAEPMTGSQGSSHQNNSSSAAVIGYRRSEEDSATRASKAVRNRNFSGLLDELNRPTAHGGVEKEHHDVRPAAANVDMHQSSGMPPKSQPSGFGTNEAPRSSPQVSPSPKKVAAVSAALGRPKTNAMQSSLSKFEKRYLVGLSGFTDPKENQRLSIVSAVERLGGEYSNGLGDSLTHLIAKDTPRSPKIISSLAYGRWILRPEWVEESQKAGRLLPE